VRHLKNAVNPKSPGIRRKARHYERKLRRILTLAARQYPRPTQELSYLYKTAVVEGIRSPGDSRTAVITFKGPPLGGSVLDSFEWSTLDEMTEQEIAQVLSQSLRTLVSEKL
jgi:hypothetical protein